MTNLNTTKDRRLVVALAMAGVAPFAILCADESWAQPTAVPQVSASPPESEPKPSVDAPRETIASSKRYGLTPSQLADKLRFQDDASKAAVDLAAAYPNELLATIIDDKPASRVTMVFSRDVTVSELRDRVPASIRSVLQTKRSRFTGEQIAERQKLLTTTLVTSDIANAVSYDFRNDKFIVSGDAEEDALKRLIPVELRNDVIVRKGRPSLQQADAQPGDNVYGSWAFHDMNNVASCTFGFPVKVDTRQAILTAAHCPGPQGKVPYGGGVRTVTLPTPVVNEWNTVNGRTYDYRVYPTTTLGSGPFVWGWNSIQGSYQHYLGPNQYETRRWANVNPDLMAEGEYMRVIGLRTGGSVGSSNPAHPVGAYVCKSGFKTGTTCGQVTASTANVSIRVGNDQLMTYYGVVEFTTPEYMVSAYGGDSGGSVFTPPVWNGTAGYLDIKGAGVLVAGETRNNYPGSRPCINPQDGACPAYFMPIDRVNDKAAVTVLTATTSGSTAP